MEVKSGYADYAGAQVAFPIDLQLGFVAESVLITNNTPATLYVSAFTPAPTVDSKQFTVPPRTTIPFRKWGGDHIYVGSNGQAIGNFDSLTIQWTEDTRNPFAGNAIPIGLGSQIASIQAGAVTRQCNNNALTLQQAVIVAVNTAKAFVLFGGSTILPIAGGGLVAGNDSIRLADATHVEAAMYHIDSGGNPAIHTVQYTVVELI